MIKNAVIAILCILLGCSIGLAKPNQPYNGRSITSGAVTCPLNVRDALAYSIYVSFLNQHSPEAFPLRAKQAFQAADIFLEESVK